MNPGANADSGGERRIVLVVRRTRLEDLIRRFNTEGQARFYVERLGGDFEDYRREHAVYREAETDVRAELSRVGRLQVVDRAFVPNFLFGPEDLVVVLGQDGLVANVLKYLDGQPVIGLNPDTSRNEGVLLPFVARDVGRIVREVLRGVRPHREVTMARARLNTGLELHAVNDLFLGPKTHGSARYRIEHGERAEDQSSSGVIVSTGLGSTGWLRSILAGAEGIASAVAGISERDRAAATPARGPTPDTDAVRPAPDSPPAMPWDAPYLVFSVREPWPSRTSAAGLVFGTIPRGETLRIHSRMPENGVVFSDGFEHDFLEFNSGAIAEIGPADRRGRLVV